MKHESLRQFESPLSSKALALMARAFLLIVFVSPSLKAAVVDGQLWYTAEQFLTTNSPNDNQVGRINSDASSQTRVNVSSDTSKYYTSVGLDTAAALFFAINTDFDGDATLVVGNINTGAVIQTLSINPTDYGIEALAVNPANHMVYIGVWGDGTTDTGIVKIPYTPGGGSTGTIPTNIFSGSVIAPSYYLTTEAGGSHETFATSFSLDVTNQKLYFTDEDIDLENENGDPWGPPYYDTNGIYVIDLTSATPTATQLSLASQFPATNAGYHHAVESVAVDLAKSLIYFETTNLTNGAVPEITLWYMPIAGGTATAMTLPGTVNLDSGYYGTITLDPATQILYLSSDGNSTTTPVTPGYIYALPLSTDGHSFTSGSTFAQVNSADPNLITTSLFFETIPKLSLVGTSTPVTEQSAPLKLLSSAPTITDADGVSLVSATIVISGSFVGSGDTLSILDGATNRTSGTISGTAISVGVSTDGGGNETLTLSGVDTIAHYAQALGNAQFVANADNPTNFGNNLTRTLTWSVSDGTPSIPAGEQNSGSTSITIDAVDDAPVATITPSTYSATEQTNLTLKNTGMSVSDADAGPTATMTATLSVGEGILTVTAGGSGAIVTNSGTSAVTISGTLAQINALLTSDATSTVIYNDNTNAPSASTVLTLQISDNGHTGSGGPLTGSDTATINITAVNDPPVNTVPGPQATSAGVGLAISGFAVSDPDGGAGSETTTLTVTHGTIAITAMGGASVSGSGTSNVTIMGTIAQINATLSAAGNVVYTSTAGFGGVDTLTFSTNDNGNTGTGGAMVDTDTVQITVVGPPTLAKAFGASSVPLNGTTSLTFVLTNTNPGTSLSGIGFTDSMPTGLVIATPNGLAGSCSGTVTATQGTSVVSLAGASLAAGASCSFSVNVVGVAAGTQNNTTSNVTSAEGGTGATSNTATLNVVAPPSIVKAFGASTIPLNGTTSLTFTITNPVANAVAETGVAFADSLPAGIVVATPNGLVNTCSGTATAVAGSGNISLSGGSVVAGGTCTATVNVTGTASGQYTNVSGNVSSTNGGTGNVATANLTVANPPAIAKTFGASTIPLNGTTSLTFNISNPNSTLTLNGVGFTDNFPAGLVVAAPNGLSNTCGATATAVSGSSAVSLSGASLASGATCVVSVNVTGTTAGVKNNSVQIASTEGGTGNTSSASITVVGAPTISKAFGASSVPLNGSTSLSFTIQNANTISLSGVGFSDSLPSGLVISTPNGLSGACGSGTITATAGAGTVMLAGATLAPSASCTFSVNVTGVAAGAQNNTTGNVTSTEGGTGTTSNTATLNVVAPPSIAKAFGTASVPLNGSTSLTFTITNPGANAVAETGVAFTDSLPAGIVVSTPNGLTNTCGGSATAVAGSASISLSGGTVGVGAACTLIVNVTGTSSGNFVNTTGNVTSSNGGTGNTATATLSVATAPTITKSFGASSIPLNGTSSLSFVITNPAANTIALNGVAFTDSLPAGLVVATPNGLINTCGGTATAVAGATTVSLSAATLAVNSSCTLSANVVGTTAGLKNNSVQVTSTEGGVGNTSTASITVVSPPGISKAFGAASIPLNGSTSLSFTVQNANATTNLSGVGFSDTLPAGLVISTPNGLSGTCGSGTITAVQGTNAITLSGGTVAQNASCMFSINVTGIAAGTQNNVTGTVTSTEGGTGSTATASIDVVAPPSIAKAFNPTHIVPNGITTLTFTITNPSGNAVDETGVAFTDTMPTALVVAPNPNVSNTCSGTASARGWFKQHFAHERHGHDRHRVYVECRCHYGHRWTIHQCHGNRQFDQRRNGQHGNSQLEFTLGPSHRCDRRRARLRELR